MLIVNGVIHTMDVGTIPSGFVQTQGRSIVQVGPMSELAINCLSWSSKLAGPLGRAGSGVKGRLGAGRRGWGLGPLPGRG